MFLSRAALTVCMLVTLVSARSLAQEKAPAPKGGAPVLVIDSGGPAGSVTGVAFGPGGRTLYAGGFDKVVRTWSLRNDGNGYEPTATSYRVPIGPGSAGAVNALAVSPDGRWLAVAGKGLMRGTAGFSEVGIVVEREGRLTPAMRLDEGTIYVFDTRDGKFAGALRGHTGPVLALTFVSGPRPKIAPSLLVSASREWVQGKNGGKQVGGLRLWNVATRAELAHNLKLPDPQDRRPGLAAWRTGPEPRAVRVSVAWGDSTFRTWDAAQDRLRSGKDGATNDTAFIMSGATAVTGSNREGGAHLQSWTLKADEAPRPGTRAATISDNPASYPRAITLIPGTPSRLATVVLTIGPMAKETVKDRYRLLLLDGRAGEKFGEAISQADLWVGGERIRPALAASPDGRFLAVARAGEVLVFPVQANGLGKPERLQGAGTTPREVAFVRGAPGRGLRIREDGAAPIILEVAGRQLTDNLAGWAADAPDLTGWALKTDNAGEVATFTVTGPGGLNATVRLLPGQAPTEAALLPDRPRLAFTAAAGVPWLVRPMPGATQPLLAVAFLEKGVPYLVLYDVLTGLKLRDYTGHTGPIRSLAFCRDGTLLASASLDQAVSVWSLTDLGESIGRRGSIRGLVVRAADGQLTVARVDSRAATAVNRGRLKDPVVDGAVIDGLVEEGKLWPIASAQAFYLALWRTIPGRPVVLRVAGRDVALVADQAIDERKPLFSLFITTGETVAFRQWIGWSPLGPYDANDAEKADSYIGWHRNTGGPGGPVSFSQAGQYRARFYTPGLLESLLEAGSLVRQAPKAVARPAMTLEIDSIDPKGPEEDRRGNRIIRQPPSRLVAHVDGIRPSDLRSVRWRFAGGPLQEFSRVEDAGLTGQLFTAEIPPRPWARGVHELELVVEPADDDHREFIERLGLLYLPPAPRVGIKLAGIPAAGPTVTVENAEITVEPDIQPGAGVAAADLRVALRHDAATMPLMAEGGEFRRRIKLNAGDNVLEVVAENKDLLPEYRNQETATSGPLRVIFKQKTMPPQIAIGAVVEATGTERTPRPGEAMIVATAKVILRAIATSQDDDLASLTLNDKQFAGFKPAPGLRTFRVEEQVILKPGANNLRFRAVTAGKKEAAAALVLTYRPEPPAFTFAAPASGERSADQPADVTLVGTFAKLLDDYPYTAQVVVNGAAAGKPSIDAAQRTLSLPLRLRPGANLIQVVVKNDQVARLPAERNIYLKQPPRILAIREPAVGKEPVVDLVITAESALKILGTRLTNGALGTTEEIAVAGLILKEPTADNAVWTITVPKVRLRSGDNPLVLWLRNADGYSVKPWNATIKYQQPAPSPPIVTLLPPVPDGTVEQPEFIFRFEVSPVAGLDLETLAVLRLPENTPADAVVAREEAQLPGAAIFKATVKLRPGLNRLRARAANARGPGYSNPCAVTFLPRTKLVHFDKLERAVVPFQPVSPVRRDNRDEFPEAPDGHMILSGHLEWADDKDPALKGPVLVRAWVNEFEQLGAELGPAKGLRRDFRVDLRLNRPTNSVALEFLGANLESNARTTLTLACAQPALAQRLHLLVVAPGNNDPITLRRDVLGAFQARTGSTLDDAFEAPPAFTRGLIHPLLTGEVRPGYVYGRLGIIKDKMRSSPGTLNDVVVIYFQGEERAGSDDLGLVTRRNLAPGVEPEVVRCRQMRGIMDGVRGAKLLLLSVHKADGPVLPPARPLAAASDRIAVLHYAWLQGEETPEDMRLLQMLQKALKLSGPLRDVNVYVDRELQDNKKYTGMWSKVYNGVLTDLQLGR